MEEQQHWVKVTWKLSDPVGMSKTGRRTVKAMTENDNFKNPTVPLATVTTAANRVDDAIANKKNGPMAKQELKNAALAMRDIVVKQADYVTETADNNVTIIVSSGYEATNVTSGKKPAPGKSGAASLISGTSGTVKATVATVLYAGNYLFILVVGDTFPVTVANGQICVAASAKVYFINSTKHSVTFTGLPSDVHVTVGVVVSNTTGYSVISPLATTSTII